MSPKIFIVDDEAPARSRLQTLLGDIAAACPHQLIGMADEAQSAIAAIVRDKPDIVLLDVQMPGMTGIELAAQLTKKMSSPPSIIFITAYDDFALKAFEVQALDYLLKPVRATRLAQAIERVAALRANATAASLPLATASLQMPSGRQHLSVQARDRVLLVPIADVIYLKAELKYVTVRTATQEYLIEESLSSLEAEFASCFVRVHRNALVARNAIAGVEKGVIAVDAEHEGEKGQESWQVILRGIDDRLPISRRQWSVIKALVK